MDNAGVQQVQALSQGEGQAKMPWRVHVAAPQWIPGHITDALRL